MGHLLDAFLPAQHQPCASLVVELRGDVEALRLDELVTRVTANGTVADFHLSEHQRKFAPMHFSHAGSIFRIAFLVSAEGKISLSDFFPRFLHLADGAHHIAMLFTSHLCNLQRK